MFPLICWAKLAPSEWSDLESESELIVYAIAKEIKISEQGDGSAKLRVLDTIRGHNDERFVTVVWGSEFHDQRIYEANARFILFLKKGKDDTYIGTSYGRSFWKMFYNYMDEDRSFVELNGPLGLIKNTPAQVTESLYKEECGVKSNYETRRIYIKDLVNYLKKT